ncbi:MAG: tetratricopeptide repeat protein [Spirochaetaceae bacterium]|jgi:tetratricopeptide (TPR) repeat protein|nr:tetratricopeptide repeat protein [Spirochaetaceae bacterium]
MASSNEKKEDLNTGERIANFIQKNRGKLIITIVSIVVLVSALIACLSILDVLREKALGKVEDFARRYDALIIDINEPSKEADVSALVDELTRFAESNSAYAGARAYSLLGSIYAEKKDWAQAEKAWTSAARTAAKTYLAPAALFNAAVAAEEQGNLDQAISLYSESASYAENFPAAPRSQFAVGRLYEEQGNNQAAIDAYRGIGEKWPSASTWINLARNRLITLNAGSES